MGDRTPPPAVKSSKDPILWQYSKIILESAGTGKKSKENRRGIWGLWSDHSRAQQKTIVS